MVLAVILLVALSGKLIYGAINAYSKPLNADWANYYVGEPGISGEYTYGYDIEDAPSNNIQFRREHRRPDGTVVGNYGLMEPNGNIRIVHYNANQDGFKVKIENSNSLLNNKASSVAPNISPEMSAALVSKAVYKFQKVHEARERPSSSLNALSTPTYPGPLRLGYFYIGKK